MALLEEATDIVAEQFQAYYEIQADFFSMALYTQDHELLASLWREALAFPHAPLLALLQQAHRKYYSQRTEERRARFRSHPRARPSHLLR